MITFGANNIDKFIQRSEEENFSFSKVLTDFMRDLFEIMHERKLLPSARVKQDTQETKSQAIVRGLTYTISKGYEQGDVPPAINQHWLGMMAAATGDANLDQNTTFQETPSNADLNNSLDFGESHSHKSENFKQQDCERRGDGSNRGDSAPEAEQRGSFL